MQMGFQRLCQRLQTFLRLQHNVFYADSDILSYCEIPVRTDPRCLDEPDIAPTPLFAVNYLLILSCNLQLIETRSVRTKVAAKKSSLRAPMHICQCIHVITHQLTTLEGFAYAIVNKIPKANFGSKIPAD